MARLPLPTPDGDGGTGPGPSRLRDSLDRVLDALGGPGVDAIVTVHERWPEVIGAELADVARPVSIDGGVLRVRASGAAWASHLRWSEREILARLDRLLGPGAVTALSVSVGRR